MARRLTGSFRDVVESFLLDAPTEIREECGMLVSKGYYRRGLQAALHWFSVHEQSDNSMNAFIYFPRGLMEVIFDELKRVVGPSEWEQKSNSRLIAAAR